MNRRPSWMAVTALAALAGCLPDETRRAPVPSAWDGTPYASRVPKIPELSAASTEIASRVDSVGRDILAANPQIGIRPQFLTLGVEEPTVFHRGPGELYISEGLVRQCETDGQLAAVLCTELGQMVTEHEARIPGVERIPDPLPPVDLRLTPEAAGMGGGTSDQTRLAELAKFEQARRRRAAREAPPLPDPRKLAGAYLAKAGFSEDDLTAAEPLVVEAKRNRTYELQINR